MKKLNQLLNRAQRRFVRSRPGSVLILVVALLVLMALIGTAYMTMAQFDRVTAAQHSFNTEVDLLLDGAINLVEGTVGGDLFVQARFRPGIPNYNAVPPGNPPTYNYFNALGLDYGLATRIANNTVPVFVPNPGDTWIGSRVPDWLDRTQPLSPTNIGWPFISAAINGSGTFDSPYWPVAGTPIRYSLRNYVVPGATVAQIDGQFQPTFINIPDPNRAGAFLTVIAGDADGDGIADSGLFKLPVGAVDGITYYAAVRIVDNCAAINASIATRPNPDGAYVANTQIPGDFSPVNLDLEGMSPVPVSDLYGIGTGTNPGLLGYRYNNPTAVTVNVPNAVPVQDTAATRGDFKYMLYPFAGFNLAFDQQWMQLGRRLDNPGYIATGGRTTAKYRALPITESMMLAKGFILRDPSIITSANSPSILEQKMPRATFQNGAGFAPSVPYSPSNTVGWYVSNFNYASGVNSNNMFMRPLLVARNPVSNFCPNRFNERGVQNGVGNFNFGDMITFNNHRYVCINTQNPTVGPVAPPADATPFQDPNWAFEPWTTAPTKTNVNTATFQQLYAAYWAVMADQQVGGVWQPPYTTANTPQGRMFRNPIRSTAAPLLPAQVMYLRAAIAAVNTLQLRASDSDVISRTINIPGTTIQATVYGAQKQPYITQVYARNDPLAANSWVGIELFNPCAVGTPPISLTNWQFTALKRSSMTFSSVGVITTPTNIAPQQRIVFISQPAPQANIQFPAGAVTLVPMPNLTSIGLGSEVFLMRPRTANGTFVSASLSNNTFTESATNMNDLVPVDSYDFTNLPATAVAGQDQEWDYVRPNDPAAGKSWHCVYPGPWNNGAGGTKPTIGGTYSVMPPPMQTNATALGTAQGGAVVPPGGTQSLAPYQDVPLQINNVDFGGPLKVSQTVATGNYFPFGGFARNADILQVTFIGAYKLWTGTDAAQTVLEVNTLPMDSAMGNVNDISPYTPLGTSTLAAENIGRFCPIDTNDLPAIDDLGSDWNKSRYHWATRLFDFLTVQSPQDDYLPEVDPWHSEPTAPAGQPYRYYPANAGQPVPQAVANVTAGVTNGVYPNGVSPTFNPNDATEETAPVNGLVNINTAPWRVLAAVPWFPGSVANYQAANAAVAQAITKYRDTDDGSLANPKHGHGPFRSIFELNDVPLPAIPPLFNTPGPLRNLLSGLSAATYITPQYGYLSPIVPVVATQVTGDFESQFQALARVSNLITTRSDSYTAYILIQGWRNAETSTPHLVVQRRAAIIIDRSSVTPTNPTPNVTNVPVD